MSGVKSMNKVILIGNVQPKEPVVRDVNGKDVANFTLATKDGYFDKSKHWQESTEWHDITCWGYVAQKVKKSVAKGALICVEGSLKKNSWEKDGVKHYKTVITAASITILDAKKKSGDGITSQETISEEANDMDDIGYDDPF